MSGIHLERKSRFWLDDIFDFSTTNEAKHEISLEEQYNSLSKLAIVSFFLFLCFYDLQKSITFVLAILFVISISFYLTQRLVEKREHFEEDDDERERIIRNRNHNKKKTNIDDLLIVVNGDVSKNHKNSKDIYLEKRDNIPASYRTIIPLETLFRKKEDFIHPSLKEIKSTDHIFHSEWKKKDTTFQKRNYIKPEPRTLQTDEIFYRSNLTNDHYHSNETQDNNKSISEDYLQSRLQLSEKYQAILDKKTYDRRKQQQLAPLNMNSRMLGGTFGGNMTSSSYLGPR